MSKPIKAALRLTNKSVARELTTRIRDVRGHRRRARALAKPALALLRARQALDDRALLFVLGCQRSGTSLMLRMFEKDWAAKVFGERHQRLTSQDRESAIRLDGLERVRSILDRLRYPLIVMKPLVESQHARRLLRTFPNAHVVWLYRDYRDVAASNLRRWGMQNGVATLRPVVSGETDNWRAEHVDPKSRQLIERYFCEDMNPYDAAALFWFGRNRQFLRNRLYLEDLQDRVTLLPYERLVANAFDVMATLYGALGRPFPGEHIVADVHSGALGKGKSIPLSPEIQSHCDDLLAKFDAWADYRRH